MEFEYTVQMFGRQYAYKVRPLLTKGWVALGKYKGKTLRGEGKTERDARAAWIAELKYSAALDEAPPGTPLSHDDD
jgi:hypothetical protein